MFKHTFNFYLQGKMGVPLERYELPIILDGKFRISSSEAKYCFSHIARQELALAVWLEMPVILNSQDKSKSDPPQ